MNIVDNEKKINKIKNRKQVFNSKEGLIISRSAKDGKFNGLQKETLEKLSVTLNKLARYDKGE